ncbi:C-terminal, D2-small domain, of ClpB family protein [Mycobacterium xenopi 4042]|uniref:C-terminal, D2-small domain, of ClpB family protein n=1 Tax=Mycobacterium xenopi 4042 TaxID=1299334 RepID=X7ZUU0_MYCXE|nr:C-terminal, D2-small domain, of ClpB family protein [Mycobacterium xenopi 4042]
MFHQLTQEEIIRMVELMISRVAAQLKSKDMTLELTDKAKALLASAASTRCWVLARCGAPFSARSKTRSRRRFSSRRSAGPGRHGRRGQLGRRGSR